MCSDHVRRGRCNRHGRANGSAGGPLAAKTSDCIRAFLSWVAAPWACGYCILIAMILARALTGGRTSGGSLDLPLRHTYLVVAREHAIAALLAAAVAGIAVAFATAGWVRGGR